MSKKFSKLSDDDYNEKQNRKNRELKRKGNRKTKDLQKFKTFAKDN